MTKEADEDTGLIGVDDFRISGGGPWGDMPGPMPVAEQSAWGRFYESVSAVN
jgi:hypothetical protein